MIEATTRMITTPKAAAIIALIRADVSTPRRLSIVNRPAKKIAHST